MRERGLKPLPVRDGWVMKEVENRNPLKQGLKPKGKKMRRLEGEKIRVKDRIPSWIVFLKQMKSI